MIVRCQFGYKTPLKGGQILSAHPSLPERELACQRQELALGIDWDFAFPIKSEVRLCASELSLD